MRLCVKALCVKTSLYKSFCVKQLLGRKAFVYQSSSVQRLLCVKASVCKRICVYVCVCVCVNHLNRCKTSTFDELSVSQPKFFLSFQLFKQGAAGNVIVLQPTKTAMTFCDMIPGRWDHVPAIYFLRCGKGLSQEPSWRTYLYSTIFYMFSTRLSQSGHMFVGLHFQSELWF